MNDILQHHGVLGMKWGVRRYQNSDGSLTSAGRKRYGINSDGSMSKKGIRNAAKDIKENFNKNKTSIYSSKKSNDFGENTRRIVEKYKKEANNSSYEKQLNEMDKEAKLLNKKYKGRLNDPEVQVLVRDFNKKYYELQRKNTADGRRIAEKYVGDFNEALVKDLNMPNEKEIAKYITEKQPLWDVTYISNYAWFNKLS